MSETSRKARQWRNYLGQHTDSDGEYELSTEDSRKLQQLFSEAAAVTGDNSYEETARWVRKKYREYVDGSWLMRRLKEVEDDCK